MKEIISKLEELNDSINLILAQNPLGEEFNERYFKDPKNFAKLVKSDVAMERTMNRYFRALGERVLEKIDWFEYRKRAIKGALVEREIKWKDEVLILQVLLNESLEDAFEAGGAAGETQIGMDIGFSAKQPATQAALRKHTFELSKGLTKTTIDKVQQSLLTSIEEGHTQDEAAARLNRILKDPRKASTIAHTEAVDAYSQGRLEVGRQVGAEGKQWRNGQPGAEKFCRSLDGKIIKLEEQFSAGPFTKHAPPLHPNCRCLMELVLVI